MSFKGLRVSIRLLGLIVLAGAIACGDPQSKKLKFVESGDRYRAAGKLAEATIEYRNALQQDPGAGDVRVKLADTYLKLGAGGDALREYVRAADLLPDDL